MQGFNFSKAQGYLTRFFKNSVDFNQSLARELFRTHHQVRGLTKSVSVITLWQKKDFQLPYYPLYCSLVCHYRFSKQALFCYFNYIIEYEWCRRVIFSFRISWIYLDIKTKYDGWCTGSCISIIICNKYSQNLYKTHSDISFCKIDCVFCDIYITGYASPMY